MKRCLIFAAKKGGVGKSFAARAFTDSTRQAGRTVSLWDLDGQTGSLALFYPMGDPVAGVAVEDVRDPKASASWLDALHGSADDVVLDVPGGALGDLLRTFDAGPSALVAEAKASGREVVLVSVVGTKKDSTVSAMEAVEIFGASVKHVVIKNGFFGDDGDFVIFDGTEDGRFGKTGKEVAKVGGQVVYLKKLSPYADALCDVEGLTFTKAGQSVEKLGRRHSANVRTWLDAVGETFAGTWLDPKGMTSTAKGAEKPKAPVAPSVANVASA